jgi:hypothetical protein
MMMDSAEISEHAQREIVNAPEQDRARYSEMPKYDPKPNFIVKAQLDPNY